MDNNIFSSEEVQLVTFVLGQESFGVDIMNVQEIIRIPSITVIPHAPIYVEGITNLRGNILPVIDTRSRFGMAKTERDISSRVIVVDVGGHKVGLAVDAVSEVL
ncbi:MAG: chemotaxis protein CheW [Desulfosporosinus sp.]